METSWVVLLLVGILSLTSQFDIIRAQGKPEYTLAFLGPAAASEIPTRLAVEWESAFKVAVEVENAIPGRPYRLSPFEQESDCDWQQAYHGADVIAKLDPQTYAPVIGVVGPACSGAAMSSSSVVKTKNISMVSFAATAEPISADREWFDNLFRTVYSDKYQGQAIAASIAKLNMTAVTILHTKQYYSMNLAQNINESVNGAIPVNVVMLENSENSTIDFVQLQTVMDGLDPNNFVILCLHPQGAHDAFGYLNAQGRLDTPWWYFGTDGVTALDPEDEDPAIVTKLIGEIGVAPFGGDYSNDSACQNYWDYWKAAEYPGLPAQGMAQSRSYTPYLLDAVKLYFQACDILWRANTNITALNVWNTLKGGIPAFRGCTGWVAIDPLTGSRNTVVQPPVYDLVSFAQLDWEPKGRIENSQFLTLQPLQRPTTVTPGSSGKKSKTGAVVGAVFGVLIVAGLLIGGFMLWKKKQDNYYNPTSFVRTMH
ncbi:hypothetical protein M758_3G078400 [Ceratodon purpureus]|nr:hypothetical protein M758_3G078400 [Ceratodon purpureus]